MYVSYCYSEEQAMGILELYGFRKEYTEFYLDNTNKTNIYEIKTMEIEYLNNIIEEYESSEWYENNIPIIYYTNIHYSEGDIFSLLHNYIFNKLYGVREQESV